MKIDIKDLILNQDLRYQFNPFGNLHDRELYFTLSPRTFTDDILKLLNSKFDGIIELAGRKGRGKTSHLRLIHQHFNKFPLLMLQSGSQTTDFPESDNRLIFIDSIQHIPIQKRIKLYKHYRTIVLTTHVSRRIEYALARREFRQFRFKGADATQLENIIKRRLQLATRTPPDSIQLNTELIHKLASQYSDDHRSLLNDLYDAFRKE